MSRLDNLIGRRFGRLVVKERATNKNGKTAWLCQCDCGNAKVITANNLKQGITISCGCYQAEVKKENISHTVKHGWYGTRLYRK